jgi:hypothetical protein
MGYKNSAAAESKTLDSIVSTVEKSGMLKFSDIRMGFFLSKAETAGYLERALESGKLKKIKVGNNWFYAKPDYFPPERVKIPGSVMKQRVYQYITENPGITNEDIKNAFGFTWRAADKYTFLLCKEGAVRKGSKAKDGRIARYRFYVVASEKK